MSSLRRGAPGIESVSTGSCQAPSPKRWPTRQPGSSPSSRRSWPGVSPWTEARQIAQPVLSVLGGESEALWDRFGETHRWILDSLPHAEGTVLPGTTHFPQIERPRSLAEALTAFFARHPLST